MVEIESVDNPFPNDPVKIHPKSLLEKFAVEAGIEAVIYFVERRPGPDIEIYLITNVAAKRKPCTQAAGIVESYLVIDLTRPLGKSQSCIDIEVGFDKSQRHPITEPRPEIFKSIQIYRFVQLRTCFQNDAVLNFCRFTCDQSAVGESRR